MVEWLDSRRPSGGWEWLSQYQSADACRCVSVGWLIHDGPDTKAVAPNIADFEDDENAQVSGVIHIPACAITRMVDLDEAKP
jgi:hypothetical protein